MEEIGNLQMINTQQQENGQQQENEQDEFDYKDIIQKKKECYRVEIRKKKMNDILSKARKKTLMTNNEIPIIEFINDDERLQFVNQLLAVMQVDIQNGLAQEQISESIIESLFTKVQLIIDALVNEETKDQEIIQKALQLGIIEILLPIIEQDQFKSYVYLLNNVYNLIGSLFFVDSQILEKFVDNRIINSVLNSLVSDEPTLIEQGLFITGNLISGSRKIKTKVYELELIEILFQIHALDKLNTDNYGPLYHESIKDYIWLMAIFLEKKSSKFINRVSTKDIKRIIEINFDLASNNTFFQSGDIQTTSLLTKNILDSIGTEDCFIDYFFSLQTLKNVNLIDKFMIILNNCTKFDTKIVQNIGRFIFNIIAGPDKYCEGLMHHNILDTIYHLFQNSEGSTIFQCELIWSVSNICSINADLIQTVMEHPIFSFLQNNFDSFLSDIQREVLYTVFHIFSVGRQDQIKKIVQSPFMSKYIQALNCSDTRLILSLLEGINKLLHSFSQIFTADGENIILSSLEKYNFSQVLTNLQNHQSSDIYKSVANIIQTHFQYYE